VVFEDDARLIAVCHAAEVSVGAIRYAADAIRLRPVGPTEAEHKFLLELLLRMERADDRVNALYDMACSRCLALFMEITDEAEGTISSAYDLHQIFATGQLPNQHTFSVPPKLQYSFEVLETIAWTLSWRDRWRTGVGPGTQDSEGVEDSRN
jgi:hypothetical protein